MLECVPSMPSFWRVFFINKWWMLSKTFSISIERIMLFILQLVLVVYHTDWLVNIEKSLQSWDKCHLIIVYDLFHVFFEFVLPLFIENFYIYRWCWENWAANVQKNEFRTLSNAIYTHTQTQNGLKTWFFKEKFRSLLVLLNVRWGLAEILNNFKMLKEGNHVFSSGHSVTYFFPLFDSLLNTFKASGSEWNITHPMLFSFHGPHCSRQVMGCKRM